MDFPLKVTIYDPDFIKQCLNCLQTQEPFLISDVPYTVDSLKLDYNYDNNTVETHAVLTERK